ncbi:glycosyltransferase family 39 protein [Candidatus Woesearchaeota archaeon]|nr:glycosyltransferase family 39 protein [Candidatus Woesearchaeota archaeon]
MEKVKAFLKERENQIFLGVIIAALAIRLYFFFHTYNQALWWDEADYMSIAKHYGFGAPEVAAPWRARGMSLIFGVFYWFGANEIFQRLVVVAVSTSAVFLTYILGKEMYNKKIGIIAAAILAVSWIHLFWTTRFSGEIFGMVFFTLAALCFWQGYVLNKSKWYMIACGALIAYGIFLYESVGVFFLFILIYLLATERFRFLKNKKFWWGMLGLSVILILVFIHYYSLFGQIYPRVSHIIEGSLSSGAELDQKLAANGLLTVLSSAFTFVSWTALQDYMRWPLIVATAIGLFTFLDVIIGFDHVLKNNDDKLRKDFFILWWAVATIAFFGIYLVLTNAYYEPRYIFPAFPALFIIAARGINFVAEAAEKYKKQIGAIVIIIFLVSISYSQLTYANAMIKNKAASFSQERPAGDWLKANTKPGDILLACSQVVPLVYYSERKVITYRYNNSEVDDLIKNWSVPYIIVDAYIQDCNIGYVNQRQANLTAMQVFYEGNQPVLAIFKTTGYS